MKILTSKEKDLEEAARLFTSGKIGVFPTDTAYGIGCDATNHSSVERVFEIRRRERNKPVLLLVNSMEMVEEYVGKIPEDVKEKVIQDNWPGGLTVIVPARAESSLSPLVKNDQKGIGVRIPDHTFLLSLISELSVPIIAPSANFTGEATPFYYEDIESGLLKNVDFAIKGSCTMNMQSTVVDCSAVNWKILREGAVKITI